MDNGKAITIEPIAYMRSGYNDKFGIPRQSGLAKSIISEIVFYKKYWDENIIRDIEQYSHLWLIWGFSDNFGEWSPTVRPPKLGGNKRMGVLATRSPYRPNNLGLSCVELLEILEDEGFYVLVVAGADLKDNTPIFDIKPYLPYVDSIPDADGGFAEEYKDDTSEVIFYDGIDVPEHTKHEIAEILSFDPRPQYHSDDSRVYNFSYKQYEVKFVYNNGKIIVKEIVHI